MEQITVIIADDHTILRAGLKLLLETEENITVVGEAGGGKELLQVLGTVIPDIIIMDLSMPDINGLDVIHMLKKQSAYENIRILVLTMHTEEQYVKAALAAGANGYVEKSAFDTELMTALETVAKGQVYLSSKNAMAMVTAMLQPEKENENPYTLFSKREVEVLHYLVRGYSLGEIGDTLHLSLKTIDTYKSRIYSKLCISRRSELVDYALKHGFLQ